MILQFPSPLISGKLIKRYKRFLADVILDNGDVVTAHCPNSGSMLGAKEPRSCVYLTHHNDIKRKLAYTWQLSECLGALTGINTHLANPVVHEALLLKKIPSLDTYQTIAREVKADDKSRLDFCLSHGEERCFLEVKSVHLSRTKGVAEFPDAITARGAKHLETLISLKEQGHRAVMLYVIQRGDCETFQLAEDIDPTYVRMAKKAYQRGVEFFIYTCAIDKKGISLDKPLCAEYFEK